MPSTAPIGVFDSGLGGLSVLHELRSELPNEHFIYYGDNLNAPYGVREPLDILRLSRQAAQHLMGQGIKALVIACNTATGVALEALQQELPIPVIGIQPALEAAQALRKEGDVLVLATPATFKTERYRALKVLHGEQVIDLPCPGLMDFVERGELEGPWLDSFLTVLFSPIATRPIDCVVLGCTHYPFLAGPIALHFPGVPLVDDSPRVAAALKEALAGQDLLNDSADRGTLRLQSSGGQDALDKMQHLV